MDISLAISIGSLWGKVWPFLVAILYFGFLILSHELGHFSVAKAFKVRVNEFSLGMGPRLLKYKRGETTYSLKAVPFGGSVLMEGEDESTEDPRGFLHQKAWKRVLILISGAFVNLVCGVLIMIILVSTQSLLGTMQIHSFQEGAVSAEGGLLPGDEFRKINGKRVYSSMDITFLLSRDDDGVVDLVVRRGGENVRLDNYVFATETTEDGQTVFARDFSILGYDKNEMSWGRHAWMSIRDGARESVSVVRLVWLSLLDMVSGKFSFSDISGPVGVVQMVSGQAQEAQESAGNKEALLAAVQNLLFLFALISINIGIMNLLPLPALDGGRIFFCLIEVIFRKPVPKRFEAVVHGVGMLLLFAFMIVISFSDILAWIQGRR